MQTFEQLKAELVSRLQVASNSTLYPDSRIEDLIQDAYMWATGIYPFAELTRARTATQGGTNYYFDYPQDFRTDSIDEIYVDGVPYDRKAFKDFREYRRNNPSTTEEKIFADYGRQYFIFPTPILGAKIDTYGQIQAPQLTNPTDTTIFSLSDQQGNEVIVKKALSVAIKRNDVNLAVSEEKDALGLLTKIFANQKARQQTEQKLDQPYFAVPDFFGANIGNSIGNFREDTD